MSDFIIPTVREILDSSSNKYGDKTFLTYIENGELIEKSFLDVRKDSLAFCRYLRNISSDKMHIALIGKTTYEYLVFATAILISGNVFVPFASEISSDEANRLFERADIDFVAYDGSFTSKIEDVKITKSFHSLPIEITDKVFFNGILESYSENSIYSSLSDYTVDENSLAMIIFTSGTTGIKKGVMHSVKSFMANIMHTPYVNYFENGNTALSVLPMHHVFCFSGDYLNNMKDGVTVVLNGSLKELSRNLKHFEPCVMRVVPMIAETLLKMVKSVQINNPDLTPREAAERVFGRNIKWLMSGGAYLPPELAEEYSKYDIFLRQGYGMTEAGCRIAVPDYDCSLDAVGKVVNICDVRIKDGEIQVKTPSAMLGYYKMPDETSEMFTSDGWLRTGDIGTLSNDRQLFITGRLKNLIILSSGENVSPEAIEKKFRKYEIVSEILVFAENDRIVAEIYPDYDYCDENGIENPYDNILFIVKELNSLAKPSHIIADIRIRKDPFKRTSNGKIKRSEHKI